MGDHGDLGLGDVMRQRHAQRNIHRDAEGVLHAKDVDLKLVDEVVQALAARPEDKHVVVTGRNAKPELIEIADLVTEMTLVKHPFKAGIKAQPGIEF